MKIGTILGIIGVALLMLNTTSAILLGWPDYYLIKVIVDFLGYAGILTFFIVLLVKQKKQ